MDPSDTDVRPHPDPRIIPDTWVLYFGPYKDLMYEDVKKINPWYAHNLTYLLAGKSFDIYFK